jgi:flavin reductase (DIM6/NTAB) family NADH-FMN oxidoreductase RutF
MITYDPKDLKTSHLHSILLHSVAPRPIAFASTLDKEGNPNLSPFSFFNCFGSHPPILIFSPARRVRDNTLKHTLENVYETNEVVINVVDYAIVQQASLASVEYPKGVNEFVKAGFTPLESVKVKPFRVKESPVQIECKVKQVIETGQEGGAGNLIICEVVLIHVSENVMDNEGHIDQQKIDLVARMGGDWYCRASGNALFKVEKPNTKIGIGIDSIPASIRNSHILTGNNLGQLGNVEALPSKEDVEAFKQDPFVKSIIEDKTYDKQRKETEIHLLAKNFLDEGNVVDGWKTLLSINE